MCIPIFNYIFEIINENTQKMKKIVSISLLLTFIICSCGGVKKTENAISSGNYDAAFDNAVKRLQKDKSKNAKQIPLLKDAYQKANKRDLADIARLKGQNSTESLKQIFNKYQQLDIRQDEIILLQPLRYDGKLYNFKTNDYANDIANSKNKYSDNLYAMARPLMSGSKENSRKAFNILEKIQVINPDYRNDLNAKIIETKKRGMDYVIIKLHNKVNAQLKDSASQSILTNFIDIRTGDFTNKWVEIHAVKDSKVAYTYQADVHLDKIIAIPEKEEAQSIPQEKEVQVGWKNKLDENGNIMKDDEGNAIKIPKTGIVKATVTLIKQYQSTVLEGKVIFKNLKTNKVTNTTPLNGEAKLENIYGTYKGDSKAIDEKYYDALNKKKATFPTDSAFNKFALQTFKQQVESYLSKQKY